MFRNSRTVSDAQQDQPVGGGEEAGFAFPPQSGIGWSAAEHFAHRMRNRTPGAERLTDFVVANVCFLPFLGALWQTESAARDTQEVDHRTSYDLPKRSCTLATI